MNLERYGDINDPGTLFDAEAFTRTKNLKVIFQNLLFNAFSDRNNDLKERGMAIREFLVKDYFEVKPREKDPIFIYREYPFETRKYPFMMIQSAETKEEKNYLGWDNISDTNILDTGKGFTVGQITEAQHYTGKVTVNIAGASVDVRDTLCDFTEMVFQGYFRSNYVYAHPDGFSFYLIHIGAQPVEKTLDTAAVTDTNGKEQFPVYTGKVVSHFKLEHYFVKESYDYIFRFKKTTDGTVL